MNESTQLYSYRFGQFELQPGERRLLAAGVPVAVQRRAFDVLVALVERAGHLVSKDELLSLVWPKLVVEESNLHVQVSALRKILGPTAIAAVSGQGYRFMWEVSREALDAVRPPPAAKLVRSRRWRWTAGSVAILLIGAGGAWWLSTETVHHLTSPALSSTLSITILPLDAPDDENLAKLLLPEITDAFGRNARSVRVTSPPMAASFRGKEADARAIGQSVDVRYVAAGEIRRINDKPLLTERLIDTVTGVQQWSEKFEFPAAGIPEGYGAFSWRVGMHIWLAMRRAERDRAAHRTPPGNTATELWLRGLAVNDGSLKGTLEARKLFEEALQLDPRLMEAMLNLGETYERQIDRDPQADGNSLRRALDELSLRAIATDGSDPRAWELRAIALNNNGRWEEMLYAVAELHRIEPYRASAFGQRAQALIELGRSKDALVEVDQGLALDQSWPGAFLLRQRCKAYSYLGQYQEAVAACEKAASIQEMLSPYIFLTADFAQLGELDKAESAKARLLKFSPGFTIARSFEVPNVRRNAVWLEQAETHVIPGLRKAGIPDK
jgi:DNA-binding winged helix-turn-helix (wHTH) protein/TolB-like protein/tetratricopeptide (TPR) repeat protein